MSILFSKVVVSNGEQEAELLVSGFPREKDDLAGWLLFEGFVNSLRHECLIQVYVRAYAYGDGVEFIATPEEVAYMTIRKQMREDFLETRCHEYGEDTFYIKWSP